MSDVTRILKSIEDGNLQAADELLPLVYAELRKLAASKMAREKPGQTLQPTALVHEAYLRLVSPQGDEYQWDSRGHFFAAAAEAMRRILIESARRKKSLQQGGEHKRVKLMEHDALVDSFDDDVLLLDEALSKLAEIRPDGAELVRLRVFAGLSTQEAAEILRVPERTARRTWTYAQAWLRREMRAGSDER